LLQAFGKILAEFTQSFRPTVQIVTIPSLPQLRPVISSGLWLVTRISTLTPGDWISGTYATL